MTWGVDDVDLGVLVVDRHVLRENGDAALALQLVVVEHEVVGHLILTKKVAGVEHLVDQSRLAMVNVCDNRNITDVLFHIS